MTWLQLLKSPQWKAFVNEIKTDQYPKDMKDYVVYSKLMRDNKKQVDWYLSKGSESSSTPEKKKLFRLILGEMRRDNNFNYWMEDASKMLKASPARFDIPYTLDKWYNILENPKSANAFRKLWNEKKNAKPNRGTLGKAKAFLNKPKNTLINQLANFILNKQETVGREAMMQKPLIVSNLSKTYDLLADVIQEIKDKPDQREGYDVTRIFKNYIDTLVDGGFQEEDLSDFEEEADEYFGLTQGRGNTRKYRIVREKLGNEYLNKMKGNIPEDKIEVNGTEEYKYKTLIKLFTLKDFKTEEDQIKFSSSFDKSYEIVQDFTLDLAHKYLENYQTKKGQERNILALLKGGKSNGANVLTHLQRSTSSNRKAWTSKLFLDLLNLSGDLDGLGQWSNWSRQVEEKYKIREEELKQTYLKESWETAQSTEDSPYRHTLGQGFNQFTLQGHDDTEEQYNAKLTYEMNQLTDSEGNQTEASKNWMDYRKEKTDSINSIADGVGTIFVDFIKEMNAELVKGNEGFKTGIENAIGEDDAKEYITAVSKYASDEQSSHGFKITGSATLSPKGKATAIYMLPSVSKNIPEVVVNFYAKFYERAEEKGNPEGSWGNLNRAYLKYKKENSNRDTQAKLSDIGSKENEFKEITNKFTNRVQKTIAQLIYTLYLDGEDIEKIFSTPQHGRKTKISAYDYGIVELIRTLKAAEDSLIGEGGDTISSLLVHLGEQLKSKGTTLLTRKSVLFDTKSRLPFGKEITDFSKTLTDVIPKIKQGFIDTVKDNIQNRIINNTHRLKHIPHILEDLEAKGFIKDITPKPKGDEEE